VVQVANKDPRDELSFRGRLSRETSPGYPRATGYATAHYH